jgi:hypothetical protein
MRTWITASPPLTLSARDDSTLISCASAHGKAAAKTRVPNKQRTQVWLIRENFMMLLLFVSDYRKWRVL